jgi:hypothetical protein
LREEAERIANDPVDREEMRVIGELMDELALPLDD